MTSLAVFSLLVLWIALVWAVVCRVIVVLRQRHYASLARLNDMWPPKGGEG